MKTPSLNNLVMGACLVLFAGTALAGTTGTEFQTMYTTLLNWASGYLGKSIAIAAFILGAGIGIARSPPTPYKSVRVRRFTIPPKSSKSEHRLM